MATTIVELGNYAQALQYRYEALTLALKVGDREVEARVRNDLGEDLMHLGCYADACTMLAAAVDLGRALNCLQITAGSLEGLARAHHHLGDQVRAQQCIEEALYLDSSHTLQQMRGYFLTTQGYIFEHMGRHMEAACAYQASLAYWQKHQSAEAALEGQAGLIRLALAHRDQATAAELAKHILPMLTARGLSDALEPMNVYLSCWKALAATKHPHADELLALSYDLLQNQAAQISNPVLRASFLQSISSHRQIVSLFNRNLIAMPISPLLSLMRSEQPRLAI